MPGRRMVRPFGPHRAISEIPAHAGPCAGTGLDPLRPAPAEYRLRGGPEGVRGGWRRSSTRGRSVVPPPPAWPPPPASPLPPPAAAAARPAPAASERAAIDEFHSLSLHFSLSLYFCIYIYFPLSLYFCIYIHVCMYVCMYVCICMYVCMYGVCDELLMSEIAKRCKGVGAWARAGDGSRGGGSPS